MSAIVIVLGIILQGSVCVRILTLTTQPQHIPPHASSYRTLTCTRCRRCRLHAQNKGYIGNESSILPCKPSRNILLSWWIERGFDRLFRRTELASCLTLIND